MAKRTAYCGNISTEFIGKEIVLKGWVQERHDLGGVIPIDLRGRKGIVRVVFNPEKSKEAWEIADKCRSEYVIEIKGQVVYRDKEAINLKIKTGEFEVMATDTMVSDTAKTTPFTVEDDNGVNDELRMKYHYLDLRRPSIINGIKLRHQAAKTIRHCLGNHDFLDTKAPYLGKPTPEGVCDYLAPSRVHAGHFYALPQSPQFSKQLLMGAGFDHYYQIVRYPRDKDLRGDRRPELTQIDIEATFLIPEEIQIYIKNMLAEVTKETERIETPVPFLRTCYDEAMTRCGSDKPNIRFATELIDVVEVMKNVDFRVFQTMLKNDGHVKALSAKGATDKYPRKDMDNLGKYVGQFGVRGSAWLRVEEDDLKGPTAKFLTKVSDESIAATNAEIGDVLMFGIDKPEIAVTVLGVARIRLGRELSLIDELKFNFLRVVDQPLFEYDEEAGRYVSAHHPSTQPKIEDMARLATDSASVHTEAYDVVSNGYELGGGSLRTHTRKLQEKMFETLGSTKGEAQDQFGFLLDALDYDFPLREGIALGLDRLAMLLTGEEDIREVTAFPKNEKTVGSINNAPSLVSPL